MASDREARRYSSISPSMTRCAGYIVHVDDFGVENPGCLYNERARTLRLIRIHFSDETSHDIIDNNLVKEHVDHRTCPRRPTIPEQCRVKRAPASFLKTKAEEN